MTKPIPRRPVTFGRKRRSKKIRTLRPKFFSRLGLEVQRYFLKPRPLDLFDDNLTPAPNILYWKRQLKNALKVTEDEYKPNLLERFMQYVRDRVLWHPMKMKNNLYSMHSTYLLLHLFGWNDAEENI